MLPVYQAFDRVKFSEVPTDDARALEDKLERASRALADRDGWLAPHQRIGVLRELARLVDEQRERFTQLIAREGGRPYTDAAIEVARAPVRSMVGGEIGAPPRPPADAAAGHAPSRPFSPTSCSGASPGGGG